MGASWLEVETLLKRFEGVEAFPHAEALPAVARARLALAEAAVIVSVAGLSDDPRAETDTVEVLARTRHLVGEAETAVQRGREAVAESRLTRDEAQGRIQEARRRRARDRAAPFTTRAELSASAVAHDPAGPPPAVLTTS